jgi:hypothetical protein
MQPLDITNAAVIGIGRLLPPFPLGSTAVVVSVARQPLFESAVVGFDAIVGVLLDVIPTSSRHTLRLR